MHTLSEKVCARISELPNRDLAAPPDPQAQRRQAHRKPRGRTFIAVDESFDRVAREAERDSDLIAKRTAGLSAVAKCQSRSRPSELSLSYPLRIADESQSPFGIAAVLAAFWRSVREAMGRSAAIGENDTADFFAEIWPGSTIGFGSSNRVPPRYEEKAT